MKQLKHLLTALLLIITVCAEAQVGIGTTTPAASAQLDVSSTTKGFLPPRMTTTQRDAIASPAAGLIVFNSSSNALEMYTGSKWISMGSSSADALPTIQIGTQKWQAKNLDVAFYKNGDPIPQVRDAAAWAALTTGAWCYYNNDSTLGTKYGKLYNWYAVNDARGLAPQGWHIPGVWDWYGLGGASVTGGQMKEAGTVNWNTPNTGGNNNSGFAGLPGGLRLNDGTFSSVGSYGVWYAKVVNEYFYLTNNSNSLSEDTYWNSTSGFSVRCLRD